MKNFFFREGGRKATNTHAVSIIRLISINREGYINLWQLVFPNAGRISQDIIEGKIS